MKLSNLLEGAKRMGAKTIPPHSSPLKRYISGSGEPVICQAEWQEEGREQLSLSEMARIWFRNPLQHNIFVHNIKRVTREQGRH